MLPDGLGKGKRLYGLYELTDIFRSRSAAATHDVHAELRDLLHDFAEFIGHYVVDRPAAFSPRKTGVGVDYDGQGTALCHPLYDGDHLVGPETAVHAYRIYLKSFEHRDGAFDSAAREHLSGLVVHAGNDDGKIGILVCCDDSCLGFIAVAHRLDDDDVSTCSGARSDLLCEDFDSVVKSQVTHGCKELSGGA